MSDLDAKKIIQVKTFGSYSVSYDGVELSTGARNESQTSLLMLLLFHFGMEGAGRSLIKTTLFEDRDIEDVSHAIRNVIYNMRKSFKANGLPDAAFVVQKRGIYYWTDEVPVAEDARLFEGLLEEARQDTDDASRARKLARACHSYSGRFLSGLDNVPWIYQESERYRGLFHDAVMELLDYYRQSHKYKDMYELSVYATNADPLSEWEIYVVESLTMLGRFSDAEKYYDDASDLYLKEYGERSNEHVRDFIRRLGEHLFHEHETIEEIQSKLTDPDGSVGRGYYCSLPVFQEVYRNIERTMHRSADKIFLMLCTIVDSKGNPMREGPKLDELSERLKTSAIASIRTTDTITRYGQGQYLILLINTTEENCRIVQKRINDHFLTSRQRTGVSYSVSNLLFNKEESPVFG
ncbi:MAG: bacterial transcriptional activator domain-containing protein [Bacillota bacterium]|nr:bacterial transcriptional activator domain-containing protein [Bacillota bacterium]